MTSKELFEQARKARELERAEAKKERETLERVLSSASPDKLVEWFSLVWKGIAERNETASKLSYRMNQFRYHWGNRGKYRKDKIKVMVNGAETIATIVVLENIPSCTPDEAVRTWAYLSMSEKIAVYRAAQEIGRYMPSETDRAVSRKPAELHR